MNIGKFCIGEVGKIKKEVDVEEMVGEAVVVEDVEMPMLEVLEGKVADKGRDIIKRDFGQTLERLFFSFFLIGCELLRFVSKFFQCWTLSRFFWIPWRAAFFQLPVLLRGVVDRGAYRSGPEWGLLRKYLVISPER